METMSIQQKGLILNGANRPQTLPFINPATGEHFGAVRVSTIVEVQQARRELAALSIQWAAKPVPERVRILRRLQTLLIDEMDEITAVLNQDNGKSRQDALTELMMTVNLIDEYCKRAPRWLRRRRIPSGLQFFKKAYIEQKPHGVVGVIGPWNYPLVLIIPPIVSALLAGNTVLAKPSEVTAATGALVASLFQRIPELAPYVRFLHGDGRVGAALTASKPDLLFLTGSTKTGRLVMQAAAETMTPVICELGGKDPMIVLEDADIPAAARWGVWGAFYNSGQTCMAVERVYVVEKIYDKFIQAALVETQKMRIGYSDNIINLNDVGPMTFQRQLNIIEQHLQDALAKGARVLTGGASEGMYIKPTILVDVDHTMDVMRDETFGPLMPIMAVENELHAIQLANDSRFGLSASVWSKDLERAQRVAHQLEVGSVIINDTISHFAIPRLPFGGIKDSGVGRTHGKKDLMQFTQTRSYVVGNPPPAFDVATILRSPGNYKLGAAIVRLIFGTSFRQRSQPIIEYVAEKKLPRKSGKWIVVTGAATALFSLLLAATKRKTRPG